jgi:hypothetical protein
VWWLCGGCVCLDVCVGCVWLSVVAVCACMWLCGG